MKILAKLWMDESAVIDSDDPRVRDLRRGIIFLALGIAGLLCSLFFDDATVVNGIRAGSMFPVLLGGGFLLVWKLNSD